MQWQYNGSHRIVLFPVSHSSGTVNELPETPFVNEVALTSSMPSTSDPRFADFTSTLTLDIAKLDEFEVNSISCGDPEVYKVLPINVKTIQLTLLTSPIIINITAVYNMGSLAKIVATWKKMVKLLLRNLHD